MLRSVSSQVDTVLFRVVLQVFLLAHLGNFVKSFRALYDEFIFKTESSQLSGQPKSFRDSHFVLAHRRS